VHRKFAGFWTYQLELNSSMKFVYPLERFSERFEQGSIPVRESDSTMTHNAHHWSNRISG